MLFGINNLLEAGYSVRFDPAANREFTLTPMQDGVTKQGVTDSWIHGCIEKLVKLGEVQVVVSACDMLLALCKRDVMLRKDGDFYVVDWRGDKAGKLSLSTDYLGLLVQVMVEAHEMPQAEGVYLPREDYTSGLLRERLDQGWRFGMQPHPDPCNGGYQVTVYRGETLIGGGEGYAHSALTHALQLCEAQHVTPSQP